MSFGVGWLPRLYQLALPIISSADLFGFASPARVARSRGWASTRGQQITSEARKAPSNSPGQTQGMHGGFSSVLGR